MITTPTNWDTLWNDPESTLEVFLAVQLCDEITVTYSNDRLQQCRLSASVFQDFSLGNACSARLVFTLKDAEYEFSQFIKGQRIDFTCRLAKGSTVTDKVNQGVFYIDSVSKTSNGNVTITAYDVMYQLENATAQQGNLNLSYWTILSKLRNMYPEYASTLDVGTMDGYLSDGTLLHFLDVPGTASDLSAREVIASVSGYAGGNTYVGKDNKAHFMRPQKVPRQTSGTPDGIVVTATALDHDERPQPITGVTVNQGNIKSGTGWRIIANIDEKVANANDYSHDYEFARAVVDNMRTDVSTTETKKDIKATNVSAQGVYISPLFELCDVVSVDLGNGKYYNFPIYDYNVNYIGGCWGDLNCPRTDQAVEFSIEQVWTSAYGWIENWATVYIRGGTYTPSATPTSRNMLVLSALPLVNNSGTIHGVRTNNTIVKLGTGFEELTGTFSYYSTNDGLLKQIEVTAYPATQFCPVARWTSDVFAVQNIMYYCETLPDDVPLNKTSAGGVFKIRTENGASLTGYKLVNMVASSS